MGGELGDDNHSIVLERMEQQAVQQLYFRSWTTATERIQLNLMILLRFEFIFVIFQGDEVYTLSHILSHILQSD